MLASVNLAFFVTNKKFAHIKILCKFSNFLWIIATFAKNLTAKLSIVKDIHWGMVYAPLDEADFEADVIQIITEPVGGMKLAQSIVYKTGEKIAPSFAGIQSLCGDAFANPYLSEGVNFTLGCDGSRKAADIKDNEMTVGISKAKIEEVISGLESI